MITTLNGSPIEIIDGNKKCFKGTRCFTVKSLRTNDVFKLALRQIKYDDINELYTALKIKREEV